MTPPTKKVSLGLDGNTLVSWKKLCKSKNYGFSERAIPMMLEDSKYLKTLTAGSPDLYVDIYSPSHQLFSLPEEVYYPWVRECTRLGMTPQGRFSVLMQNDIPKLEHLNRQDKTTGKKYISMNYTLPIAETEEWIRLCADIGMGYGPRMSKLIKEDTEYLKPLPRIRKPDPITDVPRKSYNLVVNPAAYDEWREQCDRLLVEYAPHAAELIKQDIKRLKTSGL